MAAPVEAKVTASTAAAAVSGLALWVLGRYVFQGAVPDAVASWVYVAVPGLLAFTAGYLTRHTARPVPAVTLKPPAPAVTQTPAAAGDPGTTRPPP